MTGVSIDMGKGILKVVFVILLISIIAHLNFAEEDNEHIYTEAQPLEKYEINKDRFLTDFSKASIDDTVKMLRESPELMSKRDVRETFEKKIVENPAIVNNNPEILQAWVKARGMTGIDSAQGIFSYDASSNILTTLGSKATAFDIRNAQGFKIGKEGQLIGPGNPPSEYSGLVSVDGEKIIAKPLPTGDALLIGDENPGKIASNGKEVRTVGLHSKLTQDGGEIAAEGVGAVYDKGVKKAEFKGTVEITGNVWNEKLATTRMPGVIVHAGEYSTFTPEGNPELTIKSKSPVFIPDLDEGCAEQPNCVRRHIEETLFTEGIVPTPKLQIIAGEGAKLEVDVLKKTDVRVEKVCQQCEVVVKDDRGGVRVRESSVTAVGLFAPKFNFEAVILQHFDEGSQPNLWAYSAQREKVSLQSYDLNTKQGIGIPLEVGGVFRDYKEFAVAETEGLRDEKALTDEEKAYLEQLKAKFIAGKEFIPAEGTKVYSQSTKKTYEYIKNSGSGCWSYVGKCVSADNEKILSYVGYYGGENPRLMLLKVTDPKRGTEDKVRLDAEFPEMKNSIQAGYSVLNDPKLPRDPGARLAYIQARKVHENIADGSYTSNTKNTFVVKTDPVSKIRYWEQTNGDGRVSIGPNSDMTYLGDAVYVASNLNKVIVEAKTTPPLEQPIPPQLPTPKSVDAEATGSMKYAAGTDNVAFLKGRDTHYYVDEKGNWVKVGGNNLITQAEVDELNRGIGVEVCISWYCIELSNTKIATAVPVDSLKAESKQALARLLVDASDAVVSRCEEHRYNACDIRASAGSKVKSPANGVIILSENLPGYGPTRVIDHSNGHYTLYGHLGVELINNKGVGSQVNQGEIFAEVAPSGPYNPIFGRSSGPHVHYEVLKVPNYDPNWSLTEKKAAFYKLLTGSLATKNQYKLPPISTVVATSKNN